VKLTPLEHDLLDHLVSGRITRRDGTPMHWGAWVTAGLESLVGRGYVGKETFERGVVYSPTAAGRTALSEAGHE
jgi:hypothetical protein